jgi:adenylate cyclase
MNQPAVNWTETKAAAIRTQLNRILASPEFAQSKRLCRFLQFIVDRALDGGTDCLKGYTIAVEVFERPATFDPAVDPVVRVMASRLRAKLHEYYDSEGCEDLIEIDLPKGSYTPKIAFRQSSVSAAAPGETIVQDCEQMARPASALLRSTEDQPSLAVLPFVNISADPKHEYFADGITDDIITDLSKLSGLFVISRHTSFAYKATTKPLTEIAAALRVRYLVEGSVRRQGDRARITANLIDTKSERSLWAERYDRDLTDIFAVQDDVAHSIVHALKIKLTGFLVPLITDWVLSDSINDYLIAAVSGFCI